VREAGIGMSGEGQSRWRQRIRAMPAGAVTAAVLLALLAVPAAAYAVRVPPASVQGECDSDTVPVVVASDVAAQSDIYSAVTLAGALGDACVVLAGLRGEAMPADQQARLEAAASGGYVVGGRAAVPDGKIAGRTMARLGGSDRWATALLVGAEAAEPGSAPRTAVSADVQFDPSPGVPSGTAATRVRLPSASVRGQCGQDTVPVVVASDLTAQSDIYSAVTLAGVLGDACIVLAGPRSETMQVDQQARLLAAAAGGYVVGGRAAVPDGKIAGRTMARLGGSDRWATALLVGAEAAAPGSAPRTAVSTDERFDPSAESSAAEKSSRPWTAFEIIAPPDSSDRIYGPYDPYYTQAAAVGSLHVIAQADVDPEAIQRTAYIITQMLANRPDVIEQWARWTYVVVGKSQLLKSTLPEIRALPQQLIEEWGVQRWFTTEVIGSGFGPSACVGCEGGGALPFTLVGEANVLCLGHPLDHHTTEDTAVHELAHGIDNSFDLEQQAGGIARDDPASFHYRLDRLYADAIASGIWEGHYAATNAGEFFAEMFQYWSGTNDNDYVWSMTHQPFDLSRQRDELAEYDPPVAEFLAEHFGEVAVTGSCHYYG